MHFKLLDGPAGYMIRCDEVRESIFIRFRAYNTMDNVICSLSLLRKRESRKKVRMMNWRFHGNDIRSLNLIFLESVSVLRADPPIGDWTLC